MEFQSVIEDHRSQIRFYQFLSLALVGVLLILAVVVPSSLKAGPYIVQDSESLYSVSRSQPWKLTVSRVEGFLKLYLTGRFDWTKESFSQRKDLLKAITADTAFQKLKDPISALESLAKNQGARGFYVLEGYRFSSQQKLIEAQVSRIIRIGVTGVVTPLVIRLSYDEASVSEQNPYGMITKAIEESEFKSSIPQGSESQ